MTPADHLTRQFLAWVHAAPRSYGETMDAWRTSCPRLTIWEDATAAGLVRLAAGGPSMRARLVQLTGRGRRALASADLDDLPVPQGDAAVHPGREVEVVGRDDRRKA